MLMFCVYSIVPQMATDYQEMHWTDMVLLSF